MSKPSKHFAGSVDDRGAGSCGLTFLGCNLGQGVVVIGFYPMGEQESLLPEVAFDLRAQRHLPGRADHDVQNGGSGRDDDQKNGKQLEEDAVLQSFLEWNASTILEPQNGNRRRARFSGSADSPDPAQSFRGCDAHRHRRSAE